MKSQQSVEQQINKRKKQFLIEAKQWRKQGLPIALQQLLISKNIDFTKIVVFEYEQNYPGLPTDFGKFVTENGVFYSFSADFNEDRTDIIEVDEFKSITNQYKFNGSERGIGKTDGFLILKVLAELNGR